MGTLDLTPNIQNKPGLILFHTDLLNIKMMSSLEHFGVESTWIEMGLKCRKPFYCRICIYRNPAEHVDWLDKLNLMIDAATLATKENIIMGDFNIAFLKPHAS